MTVVFARLERVQLIRSLVHKSTLINYHEFVPQPA